MFQKIRNSRNHRAVLIILMTCGFWSKPAGAQTQVPNFEKVCSEESEASSPSYRDQATLDQFLEAFFNAHPIPFPTELQLDSGNPENNACSEVRKTPLGSTFINLARACGFAEAVRTSIVIEPSSLTGALEFCPIKNSTCVGIRKANESLFQLLPDKSGVGEDVAIESLRGAYLLVPQGGPQQISDSEVAYQIISGSAHVIIQCSLPKNAPLRPVADVFGSALIGEASKDLNLIATGEKTPIEKASPLQVAFSFDREKRVEAATNSTVGENYDDRIQIKGAIGRSIKLGEIDHALWYVQVDYKNAPDAAKETDNLSFGFSRTWNGLPIDGVAPWFDSVQTDLKWTTDAEERDSAEWNASVRSLLNIPYVSAWERGEGLDPFFYDTTLVLDYLHVVRAGDVTSRANIGEAFRWGYDYDWRLDYGKWVNATWLPALKGSYKFRDTFGSGGGNADLVTVGLDLLTLTDNGLGLGVEYRRGENIDTFESVEDYSLKLTYKQAAN